MAFQTSGEPQRHADGTPVRTSAAQQTTEMRLWRQRCFAHALTVLLRERFGLDESPEVEEFVYAAVQTVDYH